MYKICFYVPLLASESVKVAMFDAGAGRIGNYEHCSFEVLGTGQFKPIDGASPFIGEVGELEKVQELRVEMICDKAHIVQVIEVMKKYHPYETPAYDVMEILNL